jgi:hypothetical protein
MAEVSSLSIIWVDITVLALMALFLCFPARAAEPLPWEIKHQELQSQTEALNDDIQAIHQELITRAEIENPSLIPRISPEPPEPRQSGYGFLPEIIEEKPATPVLPVKTTYFMKWLEEQIVTQQARADALPERLSNQANLEALVEEFESLLKAYRNIEDHLSYHNQWQRSVRKYPLFYQQRNRLLPLAQELSDLVKTGEHPERAFELRRELVQIVAPFKPAEGIRLQTGIDGRDLLKVKLCTDIEDQDFLEEFHSSVEEAFLTQAINSDVSFSLELNYRFIPAGELYGGSPPPRGAKINESGHRQLFTVCSLVMTTGASDTHAIVGNRVVLGTRPITPRTLAHEFGHLLGFGDSYLRAYEGEPGDPYGVVLIEWTGLTDDLMGRPGEGQVSSDMIDTLRNSY